MRISSKSKLTFCYSIYFSFFMMFFGCGNKSRELEQNGSHGLTIEILESDTIIIADSVIEETQSDKIDNSSSFSNSQKYIDYDNMRGFDPASEDDMDDNGMSRYMENNDEEGWD